MRAFLPPTLVALAALAGCAHRPSPAPSAMPAAPECQFTNRYDAALWVQTSAEYRALAIGAYQAAARALDEALAEPSWSALPEQEGRAADKPPAVILDLDETVLDNTPLQAQLALEGRPLSREQWRRWGEAANAAAVPGALDFLRDATSHGVAIFYVTNRDAKEEPGTLANLVRLGIAPPPGEDRLLLRGERPEWGSDKSSRRAFVAERYRVLLLIGDDLNDFVPARDLSIEQRASLVEASRDAWGRRWILLPNPFYGSWERALRPPEGGCPEILERKRSLLVGFE